MATMDFDPLHMVFLGSENHLRFVRKSMANEIATHRKVYTHIYFDQVNTAIHRITWSEGHHLERI